MQVSSLLFIGYLVSLALTAHIRLDNLEVSHQESQRQRLGHRHHDAPLSSSQIKDTEDVNDATKKYLNDNQLTLDLQWGSKTVKSVIDTTSFVSWVQSNNPTPTSATAPPTPCVGCPKGAEVFTCSGSCVVQKDKTNKDITFTKQNSFGTFVQATWDLAEEKTCQVSGLTLKDQKFGLAYSFEQPTGFQELVKSNGQFGLSYGITYEDRENKRGELLAAGTIQYDVDSSVNILAQLNNQTSTKRLVPKRLFSLKLEKDMNILSLGEVEKYFEGGVPKKFSNQGKLSWALNLKSLNLGSVASLPVADGATSNTYVIFDTATKFIWVQDARATDLLAKVNTATGLTCTFTDILQCPCTEGKIIDKFPNLEFQFGKGGDKYFVNKASYAYYTKETMKCNTYLQKLPATVTQANLQTLTTGPVTPVPTPAPETILLGQIFFMDNFVVFEQEKNHIHIAPAYQVNPDPIAINSNTRTAVLIVAGLLFVAALGALLALLTKVKYNPDAQPQQQQVKRSAVHTAPVQQQNNQFANAPRAPPAPPAPVLVQVAPQPYYAPAKVIGSTYMQGSPGRPVQSQYRR